MYSCIPVRSLSLKYRISTLSDKLLTLLVVAGLLGTAWKLFKLCQETVIVSKGTSCITKSVKENFACKYLTAFEKCRTNPRFWKKASWRRRVLFWRNGAVVISSWTEKCCASSRTKTKRTQHNRSPESFSPTSCRLAIISPKRKAGITVLYWTRNAERRT